VIIYNTCAVREHAEQKVFGNIGALVQIKREKPSLIIGLCGCMMQQEHIVNEIASKYKHVNLIFGTHALYRFPENLYKSLTNKIDDKKQIIDTPQNDGVITEDLPIKREDKLKAWVSIMSGCNNFCSYCIVPYVRGRERSRKPEAVLKEIRELIDNGYKEITLLGQNVNSYCKDLDINYDFSDLLFDINNINGDFRVRFMTSHPKDANKKLFDTIASCSKICKHIHLPFQSGSDRVLSLMNRQYTAEEYLSLIEYARKKIPTVTFTSDVIVGFPTETEEDFEQTISLIKKVGFNGLYTFIYSPRKNTPAEKMEDQISKEDKSRRFQKLLKIQNDIAEKGNSEYVGHAVRVLVDGYAENSDNKIMTGRTDNNIIVNFPAIENKLYMYTDVCIDKALNWALFGKIVERGNNNE
ncbi:MAG: tRNA-i(6)A37 methylthiotransferase, partial [Clostridia bacterium]|nr:tRNA-i(6)A37 methylthiotransferase [Clostridia bacterium]